ncbi:alpha/beta hydrolase [Mucilaginibacter sp. BT774]|uniref:alpha/beta hydrolase n=1 Tax=Mucilaginibacter sp. BT774 TaxID=3062276 RepID=UPI002675BA55|nr:alpha/beta hydrolase [Mucilaginibacter sp. BT774]MDO3624938.1 alpha/beta hydrolase [Mucilaginibacter sp. BT774]
MKKILLLSITVLLTITAFAQNESSDETPVNYKNLSGNIHGTLTMPKNISAKIPVVLIVADSGPTDRNGNNEQTGLNGNMYKLLAEGLAKNGVASVRFDKRMVGESKTANKLEDLRFDDYVDDAVGLIGILNDDQRFSKIVILGHGEGALAAMLAARDQPVKDIISINATSEQGDKLMTEQFKSKPQYLQDEFKTLLDSMKRGKTFDNVDLAMYPLVSTAKQKYLMSYFKYPPLRVIKMMKVPTLIIQGTTDLQVSVADAEKLKKAKSDATLITIKGMNHIMKEAPADKDANMETYANPALPLKAELVPDIVDFIKKN